MSSSNQALDILVPNLGPNDEWLLIDWILSDGQYVSEGQAVATVESSKTTAELLAPCQGYLNILVHGLEVRVGTKVAMISSGKDLLNTTTEINERSSSAPEQDDILTNSPRLTARARKLATELNVDLSLLPLDRIIREQDIIRLTNTVPKSIEEQIDHNFIPVSEQLQSGLLIFGGGGHAKMCIDIIRQSSVFPIGGIIDDNLDVGSLILGVPVIGNSGDLERLYTEGHRLIINGVGGATDHSGRQRIFQRLKTIGFSIPNIIHPKATVEPSARLGEGVQVMANAVVGSAAHIDDNCIINSGAVVSHDCYLSKNVHITPGAILAGGVTVGHNTLIGMGATVYIGSKIGNDVVIYNGSSVSGIISDGSCVKK